jgi:uncharacterized FAD-dependent dehydrogenase
MIRLSNIKLPLDHNDQALPHAVLSTLEIKQDQLISFNMYRRGYDARKKSNISLIYTLDVEVSSALEAELLIKFEDDQLIKKAPDLNYHYVAQAPAELTERPIVVGFGPCGLLAGLTLAQMGYNPIILDRGKEVRTYQGYFRFLASEKTQYRIQRTVW